ncbi:HNH endonuclease [Vibrio phage Athena]|uniref:Winged helix-turn-helix DNA-binding domain protein n=5 Tax=Thalassavirus TaxID=2948922 RepID=A0A6M9Z1P2_9CAUD|nr:HNH endonuclease [Vibrio phage Achelous]YP_010108158.1 HNH endonuclease [Vibrio phage AG74]YP_010108348.1 HNH endonuclease [Vibrio phage Cody]YP_010108542.1 HNH endonuclease [Vibrio phage Quinn]YP_010108736.1 HNH endonuclease [Vibrio phage Athena]QIG66428.1 hypothetical protein CHAZLY21_137 [Vibrio phage Chazly21]QQO89949.1 hypothetical protein ABURR_139 [Vibrio phage ABurr]WBU76351.1 hypothetical protein WYMAN_136 [Vibrio phage Wyman]WBU76544.1 hypothetical protein CHLORIS_135 [Vibrio p
MLDITKIYNTKCSGRLRVVNYTNASNVLVEFIDTKYRKSTRASYIISGSVKDPYYPRIFGKGYLGEGVFKTTNNGTQSKEYTLWVSMLRRCYDTKLHIKYPTYSECSVCDGWLCFQTFAKWAKANLPNSDAHLDKDLLITGNKVYSPETCKFLSPQDNAQLATGTLGRVAVFKHKVSGIEYNVTNLTKFSAEHGLNTSALSQLIKGTRKTHKNFYLVRVFYDKNY